MQLKNFRPKPKLVINLSSPCIGIKNRKLCKKIHHLILTSLTAKKNNSTNFFRINYHHVGGYEELRALEKENKLENVTKIKKAYFQAFFFKN